MNTLTHPSIHQKLENFDLFLTKLSSGRYCAWVEPAFGAASGVSNQVEADSLIEVLTKLEQSIQEE